MNSPITFIVTEEDRLRMDVALVREVLIAKRMGPVRRIEPEPAQDDMAMFIDDFDQWICVLCQEGDAAFNGSRQMHQCGRHEFHPQCLSDPRRRDIRCPVCRFPQDATPPNYSLDETLQFNLNETTVASSPDFNASTQPNFASTPL